MLTTCPECELPVSDKAYTCPHCGYPLRQNVSPKNPTRKKSRMSLPNGFGHDPRKHFVTMAKKAKMDEYAIKYIIGHQINDLTERVHTERSIQWLKEEIEKIKGDVGIEM